MQVANSYDREVYNGDLGVISSIDMEEGELTVRFEGRDVTYGFGELDELVLAYATTIHKAQGSEYPAVVIPLTTQHYTMLARNLLYTGVTRGKRLVVLVGQRRALGIAVKNRNTRRRWSKLKEWMHPGRHGNAPECRASRVAFQPGAAIHSRGRLPRGLSQGRVRTLPGEPSRHASSRSQQFKPLSRVTPRTLPGETIRSNLIASLVAGPGRVLSDKPSGTGHGGDRR